MWNSRCGLCGHTVENFRSFSKARRRGARGRGGAAIIVDVSLTPPPLENLRHANQSDSRLLHHLLLLLFLFFSCLSIVCQSVIRSIIIDYSIVLNFFFSFFINIATKKFISVVLCSRINKYLYRFYNYTI